MKTAATALVFVCVSMTAGAQCVQKLTSTAPTIKGKYTVSFTAPQGAEYTIEESSNNFDTLQRGDVVGTTKGVGQATFEHHSTDDTTFQYRVVYKMPSGGECASEVLEVTVPGDVAFKRFLTRTIVPIVGSTTGANGARFKTYLRLRDAGVPARGRVIFHSAGRPASDVDPSIPYNFTERASLEFDDIVAAMGQTGIGWLEIVPDPDSTTLMPYADVRLYNETAGGATFGDSESDVMITTFYNKTLSGWQAPSARYRLNVGMTVIGPATVDAMLVSIDGTIRGAETRFFTGPTMILESADSFFRAHAQPGDFITMRFKGNVYPFLTATDNTTNDPDLMLPDFRLTHSLLSWTEF
jgi:hypothetical protein